MKPRFPTAVVITILSIALTVIQLTYNGLQKDNQLKSQVRVAENVARTARSDAQQKRLEYQNLRISTSPHQDFLDKWAAFQSVYLEKNMDYTLSELFHSQLSLAQDLPPAVNMEQPFAWHTLTVRHYHFVIANGLPQLLSILGKMEETYQGVGIRNLELSKQTGSLIMTLDAYCPVAPPLRAE